jgi:hypothetical protein
MSRIVGAAGAHSWRLRVPAHSFALRTAAVALVTLIALAFAARSSPAQQILPQLWGTDGTVNSVARSGHMLYLAGSFNVVGTPTGGGVPLDVASGGFASRFPRVCGTVDVAIPDGAGGWFIGGYFKFVEGEPRANLAHLLADGTLASWAPVVSGEEHYRPYETIHPAVHALALRGGHLYVGGEFTSVNGQSRSRLAGIDAATGNLLPWNPGANGEVRSLLLHGDQVYVGGYFTGIGDSARAALASLDQRSGAVGRWNPGADRAVLAMAIQGKTMYVGGQFDRIGGLERNSVAALDLDTGAVTDWDATLGPRRGYIAHGSWIWPYVEGLEVQGNTVYVAGWFHEAGGQRRESVAALDTRTGQATAFDARLGPLIPEGWIFANCLAVSDGTVFVGGLFGSAGGRARPNLAALDARSGDATPWNPRPGGAWAKNGAPWDPRQEGPVVALAVNGDVVYAGGAITNAVDWEPRGGAAAIDLATGRVAPWNPSIVGLFSQRVAVVGNSVYLAGAFSSVDGVPRENCAAVDATTGALLPWNPGNVYTLVPLGDRLYGGGFKIPFIGWYVDYFAPLDLETGFSNSWIDYPSHGVETVMPTDTALYVGGDFWNIGSVARRMFAAVDPVTGTVLPWAPSITQGYGTGYATFAMAGREHVVYLSGRFIQMGGAPRDGLAAVDASTGAVLPWAPEPDDLVLALASTGNTVWAGGRFGVIGGVARGHLAVLDATTGVPLPWDARADGEVDAVIANDDTMYVGGQFRSMQGFPRGGVAVIVPDGAPSARELADVSRDRSVLAMSLSSVPNPLRGEGTIRFAIAAPAAVRLAVFDLEGRRMWTLLDGEWQTDGSHRVTLSTRGWVSGVYLCRLEAGGRSVVTKLLVVR